MALCSLRSIAANRVVVNIRTLSISSNRSASGSVQLDPKLRDELYPKSGNRDIVGFGINGYPMYFDRVGVPFPSLRFKANTPDVLQLREKEKGDWRKLSIEDKKALYRASFRMTLAEVSAPSGEWKLVTGCSAAILGVCALFYWAVKYYLSPPLPVTCTPEWREASFKRSIDMRQDPVTGYSAQYDYENNKWKN